MKTSSPSRKTESRPRSAGTTSGGPKTQPKRAAARDPKRTRQKILNTAADEFAKKGFDGARVDEIVRRCKISKNLVYHYFDSKEALFIAVLEDAYAALRNRQEAIQLQDCDPVEGIRRLVHETFSHWSASKTFIGLLNSENFYDARHIKKSQFIRGAYPALVDSIRTILERGEEQGLFRSGVDPVNIYISISALAYHFLSNQHTLSVIFGKNFEGQDVLAQWLGHVEEVILGYLQFKPTSAPR
jgi:TetR/AcrR family transcriptional regulator